MAMTPTENVDLEAGAAYVLVVPAAATAFLISNPRRAEVALARGADDDTPPALAVLGHRLDPYAGATRALFASGPVFARVIGKQDTQISRDVD